MLERLRRRRPPGAPHENERLETLERRVIQLEDVVEGLQDALHRDSVRRDREAARLESKTEPEEMARALSADARRRGL
jgi:uncharacterized coiled-coil protein SlyX